MIAATNDFCKEEFIERSWVIEDDYESVLEEHSTYSNKLKHDTALSAEAMIVLDLAEVVIRNMKKTHKKAC